MSYNLEFPVYNFQDLSEQVSIDSDIEHLVFVKKADIVQSDLSELLNKILGATGKGLKDFTIISVSSQIDISSFYVDHNIKNILIFGINPIKLGLKIKPILYDPLKIRDKKLIIAHSLEKLNDDPEGKKLLWNAMKTIFIYEE